MIDLIQGVLACLQDGCWREGCVVGRGVGEMSGAYKGRSIWLCIPDIGHIIRVGNATNRHIPVSTASRSRNRILILREQSCLLDDWQIMCLFSPHRCTARNKNRLSRPHWEEDKEVCVPHVPPALEWSPFRIEKTFLMRFIYLIWIWNPPSGDWAVKDMQNISIPGRTTSISYSNKFTSADDENVAQHPPPPPTHPH